LHFHGLRRWRGKLLVLVGAVNAGCAVTFHDVPRGGDEESPQYLGVPSRAPSRGESVPSEPELVWQSSAGRGTVGAPAVGELVTLVTTVDRWVYALSTESGQLYWRFRGDNPYGSGPVVGGGLVFVASEGESGRVTAIDLHSGRKTWESPIGDIPSPLALGDSLLYAVTSSGLLYAFEPATGERRWTRLAGASRSGPLVAAGRVAIVSLTDSLFIFDSATGAVRTRVSLRESSAAPLALANDSTLIMTSAAGSITAFTAADGAIRWRLDAGGPIYGSAAVSGDTVFALTAGCTLWRIPVGNPAAADSSSVGCQTATGPAPIRGGVLVATATGDMIFYDPARRQRIWTRGIASELRHPPIVRNSLIILAPPMDGVMALK
jgi:outer membrane protein assembly factor BamB